MKAGLLRTRRRFFGKPFWFEGVAFIKKLPYYKYTYTIQLVYCSTREYSMEERRSKERVEIELAAQWKSGADSDYRPCMLTNISREGSRLKLPDGPAPAMNSVISLLIEIPTRREPVSAQLTVKWVRPSPEQESGSEAGGLLHIAEQTSEHDLFRYVIEVAVTKANLGCTL